MSRPCWKEELQRAQEVALLIGNIAREWTFALCSGVATACGYKFQTKGITRGGRMFLEIHYPKGTWLRCECGADGLNLCPRV